jgi:hypothetical protein
MPWVEKFDGTEVQFIHSNLTVKGLGEYIVRKLRHFGRVGLCPMARPVPLAFDLMPMRICLHLLVECLGKKTLALCFFSRFGLFTSLLCLTVPSIFSESKDVPNQVPTCSSSDARFIISEANEPTTSKGGVTLVAIQSCARVTT